jgi:YVTN family beta-propeller protein
MMRAVRLWLAVVLLCVLAAPGASAGPRAFVYSGCLGIFENCTNRPPPALYEIDVDSCSVSAPTSLPGSPAAIAAGASRVYLGLVDEQKVLALDETTLQAVGTLAVQWPVGLALTPDEKRLYVASLCGQAPNCQFPQTGAVGSISVVDTATFSVLKTIALRSAPVSLAVHPNGKRVYVSSLFGNGIFVIDTATDALIDEVSAGNGDSGIAVDAGGRLYVPDRQASLVVVDVVASPRRLSWFRSPWIGPPPQQGRSVVPPPKAAVVATIPVGRDPIDVAVNPKAARAYVANDLDGTLSVVDTASRTVLATPGLGAIWPTHVEVDPDGGSVYVINTCSAVDSSGLCTGGNLVVLDTSQNIVTRACEFPRGIYIHAVGDFLAGPPLGGEEEGKEWFPEKLCPPGVCRWMPIREDVRLCRNDPWKCLPRDPYCNPRCRVIDCCGMLDTASFDPRRSGIFVAWVDGARVRAAERVEIRRIGAPEFRPLEKGAVLEEGDFLWIAADARLEIDAPGAGIQAPKPRPGAEARPWLFWVAGPASSLPASADEHP